MVAWIVDDTGFPKKGSHSVGVIRQYCGQVGKQENCRVAVSLSVATWSSSLPIAWRLYLPESWTQDRQRRRRAGVPEEVEFQTKPQLALEQIRQALEEGVPRGVVVADAGYGIDSQFRTCVSSKSRPTGEKGALPATCTPLLSGHAGGFSIVLMKLGNALPLTIVVRQTATKRRVHPDARHAAVCH